MFSQLISWLTHVKMQRYIVAIFIFSIQNILSGYCEDAPNNISIRYVTTYLHGGRLMTNEDLHKTSVNVLKPIIFLIDDNLNENGTEVTKLAKAYTDKYVTNVFIVKWISDYSSVAQYLADFISTLYEKSGEEFLEIHLVGLSSGCDIASMTADKLVLATPSRRIMRITCLDPNDDTVLSVNNVDYLDVIHSKYGKIENDVIGDAVFYIDAGCVDSNCTVPNSVDIFSDSVNKRTVYALKCDTLKNFRDGDCNINEKVIFGENVSKAARGKYFVNV